MVQLLTIIAFVALHTRDAIWSSPQFPQGWDGPILAASRFSTIALVFSLFSLCAVIGHVACLLAGQRIDRTGSIMSIAVVERTLLVVRVAASMLFIASLFVLDWLGVIRSLIGDLIALDEILCLTPLFGVFLASWASAYPIDRRLRDATLLRRLDQSLPIDPGPTRSQSVIAHARLSLALIALPVLLIGAWREVVQRFQTHTGLEPITEAYLLGSLSLVGTIGVVIIAPALLKAVWATSPLDQGEIRDMLVSASARHRIRLRQPLVWHTHGSMMNAAVLGVAWPFRYLLFTDLLLEALLPRQVEAVAAHEFGHIHHKHILWLGISGIGTVLTFDLALTLMVRFLDPAPGLFMQCGLFAAPLFAGVLVFGWVSRRFEWQADAFAARHLSVSLSEASSPFSTDEPPRPGTIAPAAVAHMEAALGNVARFNAIDPTKFAYRHGSIDDRIRRLRQIIGLSSSILPIDNTVRWIKAVSLAAFLMAVGGLVLEAFLTHG
jgi:STE24 endopeptidase